MTPVEVTRLREALTRAGERRLIWLEGEEADCIVRTQSLLGESVFHGLETRGDFPALRQEILHFLSSEHASVSHVPTFHVAMYELPFVAW